MSMRLFWSKLLMVALGVLAHQEYSFTPGKSCGVQTEIKTVYGDEEISGTEECVLRIRYRKEEKVVVQPKTIKATPAGVSKITSNSKSLHL